MAKKRMPILIILIVLVAVGCGSIDLEPPVITEMTGPKNGETIEFDSVSFPIKVDDNISTYPNLYTRSKMDGSEWSDWDNGMVYIFELSEGVHIFQVQAKDEAGNVSETLVRTFTVALSAE